MKNENLKKTFEQLSSLVVQTNQLIESTELNINKSLDLLMNQSNPKDFQMIQSHVKNIKTLMTKAKKGENVDKELKTFENNIKNGRNSQKT